jgi:putative MATE family efflux protein
MIGFGAMTIYGIIDMFWVGRLGTPQVAAVTLVGSIMWVISSINQVVGTGSVALIARRFGEKRFEETTKVIKQTMLLKVIIPIVFVYPFAIYLRDVLRIMKADSDVIEYGCIFGRIMLFGLPIIFLMYTIYTAFRGVGEAPKSMYLMVLSTILNIVLDPFFIFDRIDFIPFMKLNVGLGMGIAGAAYATVLSALIPTIIGYYLLLAEKVNIKFPWKCDWLPDFRIWWEIMKIGIPSGIENFMRSGAAGVEMTFVSSFGSVILAAFGFTRRILELGITFAMGMGMGNSAIVGQCLGAEKPVRAGKTARTAAFTIFVLLALIASIEIIFAQPILAIFSKDLAVIQQGKLILIIIALVQPFVGTQIVINSTFKGAGNTIPPLFITSFTYWGIEIPLIYLLINIVHLDSTYIFWSMVISQVIGFINIYLWFRRGDWKNQKV